MERFKPMLCFVDANIHASTIDADANNKCNVDANDRCNADTDANADADAVASLLVFSSISCVIRSHDAVIRSLDAVIDPSWIGSNQTNMLPSHHAAMLPHTLTPVVRSYKNLRLDRC
jgi:hypothetical protein